MYLKIKYEKLIIDINLKKILNSTKLYFVIQTVTPKITLGTYANFNFIALLCIISKLCCK